MCWRNYSAHITNPNLIFCYVLFWREIFDAVKEVFRQEISQDSAVALLGVIPANLQGKARKYLLNILLTAAAKCATIRWLKPNPPNT